MSITPISGIIAAAQSGGMFILADDENRENEGDLIVAAQFATPDIINFMITHARGLVCLAITQERANALQLPLQPTRGASRYGTAFTLSVEAAQGVTTGISAFDRAKTIATMIDPSKGPQDIVTPGHIFPLIAREGGVFERQGHTEASIDIAKLAGLNPAAVICEIVAEDGHMARLPELMAFSEKHGVPLGTVAELIHHREAA